METELNFRFAVREDTPLILQMIRELADYEKLLDEVVATEPVLEEWLFDRQKAEVLFVLTPEGQEAGFALFFHNFSTFLGRAGIYLEDLYVGRLEWWCLDWNQPSIDFYLSLGAEPMSDWTVYRIAGKTLTDLAAEPKE